jgi:ParB family chromosome partitioning protein
MTEKEIEIVPIAQIHIANPRPRNRARWQMIVANIREVGLKKPVTLVRRSSACRRETVRPRLRARTD